MKHKIEEVANALKPHFDRVLAYIRPSLGLFTAQIFAKLS